MTARPEEDGPTILAGYRAGWIDAPPPLLVTDADREQISVPPGYPGVVVATCSAPGGRPTNADVALTVGPDPGAPWVNVPDVEGAVELLRRVVTAPRTAAAALALVHVLRAGQGSTIGSGLVLESLAYSMLQSGPAFADWRAENPPRPAEPCRGDEVISERQSDRLRIMLNRPARHNAYNRCMRDLLLDALAVAGGDPTLEVELSGIGPSFCSGGDLDEFGTFVDPVAAHATRVGRSPARLLASLSGRVTARVHGSCAGSGIELPAFAGRVVAHPETRFWLPELAMGLIPGAGGTVSMARRIGRHRTAWMALSGQPIDTPTALAWGLVDGVG